MRNRGRGKAARAPAGGSPWQECGASRYVGAGRSGDGGAEGFPEVDEGGGGGAGGLGEGVLVLGQAGLHVEDVAEGDEAVAVLGPGQLGGTGGGRRRGAVVPFLYD